MNRGEKESLHFNRDECYYKVAIKLNSADICKKITLDEPNFSRDGCLQQVAEASGDVSICEEGSSTTRDRSYCYLRLAKQTNHADLCEKIPPELLAVNDITIKNDCYVGVALEGGDISLCSRLVSDVRGIDWCRSQVAGRLNDPNLCEKIVTPRDRDGCWDSMARDRKDTTYCEKITDQYDRKHCLEIVNALSKSRQ